MKKIFLLLVFTAIVIISNAQTPTITSFGPSSGAVGTLVTITGTNLGNPTAFSIGGVTAIVVSDTAIIASNLGDTLVGLVMPGATTGAVSVTTPGGTATSVSNFTVTPTSYPSAQQSPKMIGSGATGNVQQGTSVSISADGNTALVGGDQDNRGAGAVWVYTRSGGTWTQQGNKLVGTGYVNSGGWGAYQGISESLSADGNTAIVGGYNDSSYTGAAWIFTRWGGTWTQQGSKLVGSGVTGGRANQGKSVSISADGNTAIVGGYYDNNQQEGAVWVFTRSSGTWTQQGSKLVGTGSVNNGHGVYQGNSVSISADGNTAIVGGYYDNTHIGAVWLYTRSGGTWTQQGSKLVGTGAIGTPYQGCSVSISADGNTAIVGGPDDNSGAGATWIYTRSGNTWTQQGSKLVGTGAIGAAQQGTSVSISADGNTAIVGGYADNSNAGATWVFTRSGGTWTQQGSKIVGALASALGAAQGQSVSLSADGSTAIIGGPSDNYSTGAVWVFASTVTGIENISDQNSIILYPNPSSGKFHLQITNYELGITNVEVYNVLGEKIPLQLSTVHSQLSIDISNQPDGIYFYRIADDKGSFIASGKLVIQK